MLRTALKPAIRLLALIRRACQELELIALRPARAVANAFFALRVLQIQGAEESLHGFQTRRDVVLWIEGSIFEELADGFQDWWLGGFVV